MITVCLQAYRTLSVDVIESDDPLITVGGPTRRVSYPVFLDTFSMNMCYKPSYFPDGDTDKNQSSECVLTTLISVLQEMVTHAHYSSLRKYHYFECILGTIA